MSFHFLAFALPIAAAFSTFAPLAVAQAPSSAGLTVVLKVPCDKPGLRKCEGEKGQKGAFDEWTANLMASVKNRTDCLYEGKQFAGGVDANGKCTGKPNPDPRDPTQSDPKELQFGLTCPLVESEFTKDLAACHKIETPSVTVGTNMLVKTTPSSNGDAESAWANGALVMANSCFFHEIVNEMRTQRQVTLHSFNSTPTLCQGIAEKLNHSIGSYQASLPENFGSHANLADIDSEDTRLKISMKQMQAQRLAIESLFQQALRCEIGFQAGASYTAFVDSPEARDAYRQKFFNRLKQTCTQCKQDTNQSTQGMTADQVSQLVTGAVSAGSSCMSKCYANYAKPSFKKYLETLYPSGDAPSCIRGDQSIPPAAFGGMIAPVFLRRRRRDRKRGNLARRVLTLGLALVTSLGLLSCNGGDLKDDPNNLGTAYGVKSHASGAEAYNGASAAADTLDTGMLAGGETAALEGTGAGAQTTAAATALANPGGSSDTKPSGHAISLAGGAAGLGSLKSLTAGASKGEGSGAFAATAGSGADAGLSGSNSAPTRADSPFAPRDPASYGGGQGAGYADGGGAGSRGAAAGGGGGGFENPFALLGFGGGEAGAGAAKGGAEQTFGNGRGVNPMGSPDPKDYFMRSDSEVSLFKRVENCVNRQARSWALVDAENAVKKSKSASEPQRLPASQNAAPNALKAKDTAIEKARLWGPVTPGGSGDRRQRTF